MAGAGYKQWVDGDILTAGDVNTYLMDQAVMVFADAAARTSAIAAPSEGMITYLANTNAVEKYTGSAWVNVNDNTDAILKTIVDAKGDLIAGTGADTVDRLAVGTNGHVLTADSSTATGLKWAAASTGDWKLLATNSPSAASTVSFDNVFTSTYLNYAIFCNFKGSAASQPLQVQLRASGSNITASNYNAQYFGGDNTTVVAGRTGLQNNVRIGGVDSNNESGHIGYVMNPQVAKTTVFMFQEQCVVTNATSPRVVFWYGLYNATTQADGLRIYVDSGNFTGEIAIYGLGK